jgi:predicted ATP-grasp superfamily ATP-dependent carboligase
MTVIVLDGNENQAVAAVRSLHRAGYRVTVGAATRWSKAGWSRGCACQFMYPAPEDDARAFVTAVAAEAARDRRTLVLPMTERTTLPLSRERDVVTAAGGILVLPSHDIVVRAFDKEETTRLAASIGVDVPRTITMSSPAEARDHASTLPYPVVVKPKTSQEYVGNATVRTTGAPVYARTASEFLAAWSDVARRSRSVLVQEFIEGDGCGYFALMRHGELRAEFAHRRLRDVRPTGSGSALRVSVAPDPRAREAALAVLMALKWHGVAMVEFRRRPDGTPVFLEVNGRFWNSLALAVHSGVDFPVLLARLAVDDDVEPVTSYRTGVRCRWLLGDVRHLVEVLRGRPFGYPAPFPGRLRTLAAELTPVRGTYHDNFSPADPLPELGDWLDFVLHKLRKRVASHGSVKVWNVKGRPSRP